MTLALREAAPAPARTWANKLFGRDASGYLFLTPWLVGIFGLTIGPALVSLYLSFTRFDLITDPQFVGLANYRRIFLADAKFLAAMKVTFTYVLIAVPLKLAFALAVAMILNKGPARPDRSIARCSTCPRCWAAASPSPCCGARSSPATGCSTRSSPSSASRAPSWIVEPRLRALHAGGAVASGSSARR